MFEIFLYALNAVLSILLISAFGFALRKKGRVEEGFIKKLNSFCFNYLLPLQLFMSIYGIEGIGNVDGGTLVFIAVYIIIAFIIGMTASLLISPDNARRGCIAQAFFRSNTAIMGVPLAELLGGREAVALISIMMTVTVIMYNALAVVSLTIFAPEGQSKKINVKKILADVLKNPLIRGIAVALLCLLVRSYIPCDSVGKPVFSLQGTLTPVYNALNSLSKAASPMMMLLIGMQFEFKAVSSMKKEIIAATFARTVLMPAFAFTGLYVCTSVFHLFSAGPAFYQACMGIVAAPAGIAAVVMTAEMGGDGELAGQIVVWSTVISVFTIFGFTTVLRYLGLM